MPDQTEIERQEHKTRSVLSDINQLREEIGFWGRLKLPALGAGLGGGLAALLAAPYSSSDIAAIV